MKEEQTTPLRQRMIEDMDIRGLSEKTQKEHIRCTKHFVAFPGADLDFVPPHPQLSLNSAPAGTS